MGDCVTKKVLHAGCGDEQLPPYLAGLLETRLDIDDKVKPDVVAPITDLGDIGEFDVVYCSHTLEHLYQHQVEIALAEFKRVLKKGGVVIIAVPDLTDVQCDDVVMYESPAGPITGRDMYYGLDWFVAANPYMGHNTGFTRPSLKKALEEFFTDVKIINHTKFNVVGIGVK
ncbi:methyltransferase domain-containing protein [Sulfurovum sp.]|uniref:class I SAM-dependent methyltransferase n=1 Tax=Sulfurovum sp. TaxID=1969726 RepID=UPI0035684A53